MQSMGDWGRHGTSGTSTAGYTTDLYIGISAIYTYMKNKIKKHVRFTITLLLIQYINRYTQN